MRSARSTARLPDGRIAFVSDRGGAPRIWLMPDVNGPDPESAAIDPSGEAPKFAVYRIASGGINLTRVGRDRAGYDDFMRRLSPRR
jgi:hypothetical protein